MPEVPPASSVDKNSTKEVAKHSDLEYNNAYAEYPEVVPHTAPYRFSASRYGPGAKGPSASRKYVKPVLIVASIILVALIAAIIGGMVSKKIEHDNCNASVSHLKEQQNQGGNQSLITTKTVTMAAPSSSLSASSSPSATQSATQPADPTPTTGCPGLNNHTLSSNFVHVNYTLHCATNWIGFDIAATTADSMSSCVEACWSVNHYSAMIQNDSTKCVGVTWVPGWTNVTVAYNAVKIPGNCFLKSHVDGLPPNDPAGGEVVVARLEGISDD